jgi:hypothetical protein
MVRLAHLGGDSRARILKLAERPAEVDAIHARGSLVWLAAALAKTRRLFAIRTSPSPVDSWRRLYAGARLRC